MNHKTADRLNSLLHLSSPYRVAEDGSIYDGVKENDNKLWDRIKPIIEAAAPAVCAQEIADAAKERRNADVCAPEVTPYWWRKEIPWKHSAREWRHCRQQIMAVVEAFNTETKEEYERYRQACEQGVALPPE